jgi:hypothetical protein
MFSSSSWRHSEDFDSANYSSSLKAALQLPNQLFYPGANLNPLRRAPTSLAPNYSFIHRRRTNFIFSLIVRNKTTAGPQTG